MKIKNLFKRSQEARPVAFRQKWYGGYTTAEMLIAFFIMTVAISGVSTIAFGNQSVSVDTEKNSEALRIAQAVAEDKRAMAKTNFDSLQTSNCDTAGYECEVLVSSPQQNLKQITTTVSWVEGNRPQSVVLKSRVANLEEEEALGNGNPGGDPSGKVLGEEENGGGPSGSSGGGGSICPVVEGTSSTTTPINIGVGSVSKGLDVMGEFTYLAVKPQIATSSDFYIIHTNDYKNPAITNFLSTKSGGVNAVDVAQVKDRTYAYLATQGSNGQLQIVDVTDPNLPFIVSGSVFGLPGNVGSGLSVFYRKDLSSAKDYVYIGTSQNVGDEFNIVDVTDPSNPKSVDSFDVEADVTSVYVRNGFAYLTTNHVSKTSMILDVNDQITLISLFSDEGSQGANSLYYSNNKLFLAASPGPGGTSIIPLGFYALNVDTDTMSKYAWSRVQGVPQDVTVSGNFAFLTTTNKVSKEFQIVDVSKEGNRTACGSYGLLSGGSGIYYSNTWVYISLLSDKGLQILKLK